MVCFLNNETILRFQQSSGSETHPKALNAVCPSACKRQTAAAHRAPFEQSYISLARRAASSAKVTGAAEGWMCASYRHLLHDSHEDRPSVSEQQSSICHFMSVSLYLQPVLGRYGWIRGIISSPGSYREPHIRIIPWILFYILGLRG